jgi:hypothetical protein
MSTLNKTPQKNQMSKISKKGKTLGAQHASHGDDGVEKMEHKVGKADDMNLPKKDKRRTT